MKKILIFILMFFTSILTVNASDYGIENYYMDINIKESGDLLVKEAFRMNGEYNGMERVLNYRNPNLSSFDGSIESLDNSSLYNGSDIQINKIGTIINESLSFFSDSSNIDVFENKQDSLPGEYGTYTIQNNTNGITTKIFNPSSYSRMFYLEYTIKNVVINHQDIAELKYNLFTSLRESVGYLEVTYHLPSNNTMLKGWGHGKTNGDIEIVNDNTAKVIVRGMPAYTPIDVRLAFDKDVVSPKKRTNLTVLDHIIDEETKLADEINKKRTFAKILILINVLGCIILTIIYCIMYKRFNRKYKNAYKNSFTQKYFRDIPREIMPSTVCYLINKTIGENAFSADVSSVIERKMVLFDGEKDNIILYKNKEITNLSEIDNALLNVIFDGNKKDSVSLEELKKIAKRDYNNFLDNYDKYKKIALKNATQENYFEKFTDGKKSMRSVGLIFLIIIFAAFGLFCSYSENGSIDVEYAWGVILISFFISVCVISTELIVAWTSERKTKAAFEEYEKWMALKRFMEDFGRMDEKDLPEIRLWEKYLVYAHALGCAEKLEKTMRIKINELNQDAKIYNLNTIHTSSLITSNITSSVRTASSTRSAQYSSSSSSGFGSGGGFSGGGGSGGGGGGGGRF